MSEREGHDREERVIDDGGDLRQYRIEIPNMLDDSSLDPYAFRLYLHYKRRAGDAGACFETMRQIAKVCHMSLGQVSKARALLVERKWVRLTTIKLDDQVEIPAVRIVNIWDVNFARYAKQPRSLSEQSDSDSVHEHVHTVNGKKEPEEGTKKKGARKKWKRRTTGKDIPLPDEMRVLTDEMRAAAAEFVTEGVDIEVVHHELVSAADARSLVYVNWMGAWHQFLARALKQGRERGTLRPPTEQKSETIRERRARLAQEAAR